MITIYRVFISIHFIKTVTTAFSWNKRLNCGISYDINPVMSLFHPANKCLIFCLIFFFYILLNICFIGQFLLTFIQSHTIDSFYISSIFFCRSLQVSLYYLDDTSVCNTSQAGILRILLSKHFFILLLSLTSFLDNSLNLEILAKKIVLMYMPTKINHMIKDSMEKLHPHKTKNTLC